MLVGLDEQLMRGQPRAEILVKRGTQLRIERDAGGELVLDLPGDEPAVQAPDEPAMDKAEQAPASEEPRPA